MGLGGFQIGTTDFCLKILVEIKTFKYTFNIEHRGRGGKHQGQSIVMVILYQLKNTIQKCQIIVRIKKMLEVLAFDRYQLFRAFRQSKMVAKGATDWQGSLSRERIIH